MAITRITFLKLLAASAFLLLAGCGDTEKQPDQYDVLIKGGTVYDGTGARGRLADVGVRADRIVAIGDLSGAEAATVIDASGKAVAPGFINMLSWATDSLILDGRGLSDTVQGVTLEVFGEGWSMGPLAEHTKADYQKKISATPQPYEVTWTGFGEYLEMLESKGISPNVASYVGATTVRINHVGYANRAPTEAELEAMKAEVATAMEEGAMGLGTSLIYAPAFYAKTDELIALASVAGQYGGRYISHMRSEGSQIMASLEELITIAREADLPAEIYHLKAAGKDNWAKLDDVIARVEAARAEGLDISADMYSYTAGATGLDAAMPPWVQEGTHEEWAERLKDPDIRKRLQVEMTTPSDDWENLMLAAGPEGVLLPYFQNPELKKYTGMRLSEVAEAMGKTPEEAAMDLVIADGTRVSAIYFLMSEDNVKKKIRQPWVAFGSDAEAVDPAVAKEFGGKHPRTYGNVARLLGHYVRDEKVIPLHEAIFRLTGLPAARLKLRDRGHVLEGAYADIVVFDPATIADHSTFNDPHQLSTGVSDVFVNGVQVIKAGEHTGATPGRVVRGPGWTGWDEGQ
ncbi:N-acyl-D-amino-acid deacylase family protein [Kordiimonas lacus]|uniref:N-acyl-D-amino-acid deacylase n=1 Tax=Kordiimonas lacus TaxID=637679 RepID=A0A1G6Y1W8_9PROT|nr:D-aminoacylase [Kordiimonas lacus]SDD84271.1 N-acyl-D-amino-acid deacylase [Kordiimonas lacus]